MVDVGFLKFTGLLKHKLILAKLQSRLGRSLYYKASSEPFSEPTGVSSELTPKKHKLCEAPKWQSESKPSAFNCPARFEVSQSLTCRHVCKKKASRDANEVPP